MEFEEDVDDENEEMWKTLLEIKKRGIPTRLGRMAPTPSSAYPPYVAAIMGHTKGNPCTKIKIVEAMRAN